MRLSISPADIGPTTCTSNTAHHFQLGHIPVIYLSACILDYWNNIHPGFKAESGRTAAGRCNHLLPLQQFSENINPCTRHFAGSLMISESICRALCWVLRSTYVSWGNVSNVCRALMVSSLDSSSYHPKRIRSMGNCSTSTIPSAQGVIQQLLNQKESKPQQDSLAQ